MFDTIAAPRVYWRMPRGAWCAALCVATMSGTLAGCAPPAPSAHQAIVGAWELRSRTVKSAGGEVVADRVLGEQPIGRLFYGASGHMALQMMRQGRSSAMTDPGTDEVSGARVVLGYDAYFGTFTVDESAGTVTHHVQGSLFPEDLGRDFTRRFRLEGDTFELSFTSGDGDSAITRTLVFQRSK